MDSTEQTYPAIYADIETFGTNQAHMSIRLLPLSLTWLTYDLGYNKNLQTKGAWLILFREQSKMDAIFT